MATIEDLRSWMERDLTKRGGFDKNVEVVEFDMTSCCFQIYTDTNCYRITAHDPRKLRAPDYQTGDPPRHDNGYLGCVSWSRKPRAGEDWNRGGDLADGPLTEETWRSILADIVCYELVRVHQKDRDRLGVPFGSAPPPADTPPSDGTVCNVTCDSTVPLMNAVP